MITVIFWKPGIQIVESEFLLFILENLISRVEKQDLYVPHKPHSWVKGGSGFEGFYRAQCTCLLDENEVALDLFILVFGNSQDPKQIANAEDNLFLDSLLSCKNSRRLFRVPKYSLGCWGP